MNIAHHVIITASFLLIVGSAIAIGRWGDSSEMPFGRLSAFVLSVVIFVTETEWWGIFVFLN